MKYYEVSPVGIVRQDSVCKFIYTSDSPLTIGTIVEIEVGKKRMIGIVIAPSIKPSYPTKSISRVLIDTPLPTALVSLAQWMSVYYGTHLGMVWSTILRGITKKRRPRPVETRKKLRDRTHFVLNESQLSALKETNMSPDRAKCFTE